MTSQDEPDSADPHALLRDWITIWQSEAAALAVDREAGEGWMQLVHGWGEAAKAWIPDPTPGDAPGQPAAAAPPRTTAAGAASAGGGDAELDRLARRVAELEQRLAGLGG